LAPFRAGVNQKKLTPKESISPPSFLERLRVQTPQFLFLIRKKNFSLFFSRGELLIECKSAIIYLLSIRDLREILFTYGYV